MLAVPLPWPERAKPRPAAAVAAAAAEMVVVELTRPEPHAFRVRIRPEGVDAASSPVAELHVFYGARVDDVAEALLKVWEGKGMRPTSQAAAASCRLFDFAAGFRIVAWAVEVLGRRFAP
ncbi:MAG TPA: hypothetical protein VF950_13190 [Planctomycetota bacterium]